MKPSYEFYRQVLPEILKLYGLTGMGVEVGVCRGEFSEHILKYWPGTLCMVDCWSDYDGYDEQQDHQSNRAKAEQVQLAYAERSTIFNLPSLAASAHFADNSLDFVYLDANHAYQAVVDDLKAWYPKVKRGGLFAGDDYHPFPEEVFDFGKGKLHFGVRRAVDEFAIREKKNISCNWLAQWHTQGIWVRNWWCIK